MTVQSQKLKFYMEQFISGPDSFPSYPWEGMGIPWDRLFVPSYCRTLATSASRTLVNDQLDEDEIELIEYCLPGVNLVVKYKVDSGHACKLIRKKLEELAVRFKKTKMASYKATEKKLKGMYGLVYLNFNFIQNPSRTKNAMTELKY